MLNDSDPWPVTCSHCGYVFEEQIGRLKHSVTLVCQRCRRQLSFNKETFMNVLDNAKSTVSNFMRAVRLTDKPR
jgi:hypothetical protein